MKNQFYRITWKAKNLKTGMIVKSINQDDLWKVRRIDMGYQNMLLTFESLKAFKHLKVGDLLKVKSSYDWEVEEVQ